MLQKDAPAANKGSCSPPLNKPSYPSFTILTHPISHTNTYCAEPPQKLALLFSYFPFMTGTLVSNAVKSLTLFVLCLFRRIESWQISIQHRLKFVACVTIYAALSTPNTKIDEREHANWSQPLNFVSPTCASANECGRTFIDDLDRQQQSEWPRQPLQLLKWS